jgi:hypothetical protein
MINMHHFVRIIYPDLLDDFNILIQILWVNNWTPLSKKILSTSPLHNYESCIVNYGHLEFSQIPFYSILLLYESRGHTSIQHIPMRDVNN